MLHQIKASVSVVKPENHDVFIRATTKSREMLQKFDIKKDYTHGLMLHNFHFFKILSVQLKYICYCIN